MAQQAILAAQRRRRDANEGEKSGLGDGHKGSQRRRNSVATSANIIELRQAMKGKSAQLYKLFHMWDEDGNGHIDEREFARAMRMLGLQPAKEDFDDFCSLFPDQEIKLDDLIALIESTPAAESFKNKGDGDARGSRNPLVRLIKGLYWLVGTVGAQAVLYFAFVGCFNALTSTLRLKEEYYLDKMFSDTFVDNAFDEHLNSLPQIRRVADVWEWGNAVLWPGLFGNSGPACGDVGNAGAFNSSVREPGLVNASKPSTVNAFRAGCTDHTWPDGGGVFHHVGASSFTVDELVARFNELDWTEGLVIWQTRVAARAQAGCRTKTIGHQCHPGISDAILSDPTQDAIESVSPFGHNWTHPSQPLSSPFRYYTPAETGGVPHGPTSAHPASLQTYPAGGYVSIVIPFFSSVFLPDEKGTSEQVTDFRLHRATRDDTDGRRPSYFCVRLVWDGAFIHQLCDPHDAASGRTTGLVRAAIEEMWNDMKRAHYIDHATRAVTITVPFSSNNVGVRSRATFMFEFMPTGSVLSSYDAQTRVERDDLLELTGFYNMIALGFTAFFSALEIVEVASDGPLVYFGNMWNVMDWLNYALFFLVWRKLTAYLEQVGSPMCSDMCARTGYRDDWQVMSTIRDGKSYLSLCVCIQLLKIIKFTSALVPKMGLAPLVLKKALPDLVFFSVVFFITMFAFSSLFNIQLGPYMMLYATPEGSIVALGRALFGDFDIDVIMGNSPSYMNTLLFLLYLFVAVFIMLSMFFAILGESQANLRDEQRTAKSEQADGEEVEPEYGVFTHAKAFLTERVLLNAPLIGTTMRKRRARLRMEEVRHEQKAEPTPVERIEARQLELKDHVADLTAALATLQDAVGTIGSRLEQSEAAAAERRHLVYRPTASRGEGAGGQHPRSPPRSPPPQHENLERRASSRATCSQSPNGGSGAHREGHHGDKSPNARALTSTPLAHVHGERPLRAGPRAGSDPRAERERPPRHSEARASRAEREQGGGAQLREKERGAAKIADERSPPTRQHRSVSKPHLNA